jgi:hypothetical protein
MDPEKGLQNYVQKVFTAVLTSSWNVTSCTLSGTDVTKTGDTTFTATEDSTGLQLSVVFTNSSNGQQMQADTFSCDSDYVTISNDG